MESASGFSGKKSKPRETIHRMMKMLNIPDHRYIARELLEEEKSVGSSTLLMKTTTKLSTAVMKISRGLNQK